MGIGLNLLGIFIYLVVWELILNTVLEAVQKTDFRLGNQGVIELQVGSSVPVKGQGFVTQLGKELCCKLCQCLQVLSMFHRHFASCG